MKRQHSNSSEEQIKASVNRWISLDDLTPPQSSEENSFNDYDGYLDEHFGSGSDTFMQPMAETKKEKKQKKKTKPTGNIIRQSFFKNTVLSYQPTISPNLVFSRD